MARDLGARAERRLGSLGRHATVLRPRPPLPPPAARRRLRPRLVGHLGAGQHARDLLAPLGLVERVDAGAGDEAVVALLDEQMAVAAGGDLRAVGDDEQLRAVRQPVEPLADRAGDRAADAAVDLVEDHRRGAAVLGQRDLEREDEARQLAAAGDPGQRREGRAGIGRDLELDPVAAARRPLRLGERLDRRSGSGPRRASAARARAPTAVSSRAAAAVRSSVSRSAAASIGGAAVARPALPARPGSARRPRARRAARTARRRAPASASGSTRCLRARARSSNRRVSASSSRAGSKASASAASPSRVLGLATPRSARGRAPRAPRRAGHARRRSARAGAPPGGAARAALRTRRAAAPTAARSSASRAPFCMSARSAGELLLLARLGGEPRRARRRHGRAIRGRGRRSPDRRGASASAASASPQRAIGALGRRAVDPAEGVEQGAMAARVEQAAIVMLAVDLDQQSRRARGAGRPRPAGR